MSLQRTISRFIKKLLNFGIPGQNTQQSSSLIVTHCMAYAAVIRSYQTLADVHYIPGLIEGDSDNYIFEKIMAFEFINGSSQTNADHPIHLPLSLTSSLHNQPVNTQSLSAKVDGSDVTPNPDNGTNYDDVGSGSRSAPPKTTTPVIQPSDASLAYAARVQCLDASGDIVRIVSCISRDDFEFLDPVVSVRRRTAHFVILSVKTVANCFCGFAVLRLWGSGKIICNMQYSTQLHILLNSSSDEMVTVQLVIVDFVSS